MCQFVATLFIQWALVIFGRSIKKRIRNRLVRSCESWISPGCHHVFTWWLSYPKYHWTNWSDWRGSKVHNLGTIFGTRDCHKCDHCLGDSLGILCKLDNKVVNQIVWYTPWSRWSMTPIISPALHMLKLPLPDQHELQAELVECFDGFFVQVTVTGDQELEKKSCKMLLPSQFRICTPQWDQESQHGLGLFLLFYLWCLVRFFFPPVLRVGAELYSLSLLSL